MCNPRLSRSVLPALLLLLLFSACGRSRERPLDATPSAAVESAPPERPAPALTVRPDSPPRWLEWAPEGLAEIDNPDASALLPFEPWVAARRITGMAAFPGAIVLAMNRTGFLLAESAADGTLRLYGIDAPEWARPYSMGAPVRFGARAAVPLYRDGFFSAPRGSSPPHPMLALDLATLSCGGLSEGAAGVVDGGEGWELDALDVGGDGLWRLRARKGDTGDAAYYAAATLAETPRASSLGEFRTGRTPQPAAAAPPPLRPILHLWATVAPLAVTTVDASQDGRRFYSAAAMSGVGAASGSASEDVHAPSQYASLGAYGYVEGDRAWSVLSDGRGLYFGGSGNPHFFALPVLPQGFAYTGLAVSGSHLLVCWEEQDSWAVGSAGILVHPLPGVSR